MRTTINIHDDLLRRAKQVAMERNCTLGSVIEDALQKSLNRKSSRAARVPTRLPTFRGRGLQPGVDLDSTVSLLDAMEER
jgi:hypothetical protein